MRHNNIILLMKYRLRLKAYIPCRLLILKFVDAEMIEVELAQNAYKYSITYLPSVTMYVHGLLLLGKQCMCKSPEDSLCKV